MITLFYDAQCPLCVAEMRKLKKADMQDEVQLVDIHDSHTMAAYPQVQFSAANRILHAVDEQGQLYLGLDATVRVWRQVGKMRWLAVLRWPVIKWFADIAYRLFARYRLPVSRLLMPSQCANNQCRNPKT
ncbi:hypothetical protein FIU82_16750 (plasmid) [Pseudoalteromonas sp. THAF3]|uniref:thiol-disulfide oxidoreductase DCC family protein n=1 Tax=Pseudoalteromonas sp. THAF3 TaxID=2587843 RepID=UPI0012679073|nr:DUF393 domain-containing protein [Pseudoalteromonas sp. THAF3]QFU06641.1 hypothetical protein FIU82_16750 [Pseudoalteromonas sp. THAF3]